MSNSFCLPTQKVTDSSCVVVVFSDYLSSILGLVRYGNTWSLTPFDVSVSFTFSLPKEVYRPCVNRNSAKKITPSTSVVRVTLSALRSVKYRLIVGFFVLFLLLINGLSLTAFTAGTGLPANWTRNGQCQRSTLSSGPMPTRMILLRMISRWQPGNCFPLGRIIQLGLSEGLNAKAMEPSVMKTSPISFRMRK